MDTMQAFAMGMMNRGKEPKVFDWDKAAEIIRERNALYARAGLSRDWEYTGGKILENGKPVPRNETYTYLASNWATPELDIDGDVIPCYKMKSQTPDWDARTYWPESAVKILERKDNA